MTKVTKGLGMGEYKVLKPPHFTAVNVAEYEIFYTSFQLM
jgi:hypothetical protein